MEAAVAVPQHHEAPDANVWQFLRLNHFSKRAFATYDAIVDAWNALMG